MRLSRFSRPSHSQCNHHGLQTERVPPSAVTQKRRLYPPSQTHVPSSRREIFHRLWSLYHYRTLLVLYLQIHAHFLFVDILRRGRLFNCYARLLGASVGRDADVATMYFTDHDLVSLIEMMISIGQGDFLVQDGLIPSLFS